MPPLWDPVVVYDQTNATYWENQSMLSDTQAIPVPAADVRGSFSVCRFSRQVNVGAVEDFAEFGLHWSVSPLGIAPLVRLDNTSAASVESQLITNWFGAVKPLISNQWTFKDIVWRHWGADQPVDGNGVSRYSPVWRLTNVGQAGSGVGPRLPDQVSATTTFRTASRRHWGRFYAGGFIHGDSTVADYGQMGSTAVDGLAGAMHTVLGALAGGTQAINLWIWSARYRGALSVNELSVDSIVDVIRSRRAKTPNYRKTFTS